MNMNHKPGSIFRSALIIMLFFIVGFAFIAYNTASYAENGEDPSKIVQESPDLDIIIIDNKGYKEDRKEAVRFEHKKHAMDRKITCFECHHEYKEDDGVEENDKDRENLYDPWKETKKCSKCHDPLEVKDKAPKLQAAYHLACKGCHETRKIFKDKPQGVLEYRKCTPCHIKQSSEEAVAQTEESQN